MDDALLAAIAAWRDDDPDPVTVAELDRLVGYAVAYARDFVAPSLKRRKPTPEEAEALRELDALLDQKGIAYDKAKADEIRAANG